MRPPEDLLKHPQSVAPLKDAGVAGLEPLELEERVARNPPGFSLRSSPPPSHLREGIREAIEKGTSKEVVGLTGGSWNRGMWSGNEES